MHKVYRKTYICGDININPIPVTRSLIIFFTNNFEKNPKNSILTRRISDHQMICCMLPNHNVINPVNRNYIDVETINEKKHLGNLRMH